MSFWLGVGLGLVVGVPIGVAGLYFGFRLVIGQLPR